MGLFLLPAIASLTCSLHFSPHPLLPIAAERFPASANLNHKRSSNAYCLVLRGQSFIVHNLVLLVIINNRTLGKKKRKKKKSVLKLLIVSSHCTGLNFILLIMVSFPSLLPFWTTFKLENSAFWCGRAHCQQASNKLGAKQVILLSWWGYSLKTGKRKCRQGMD